MTNNKQANKPKAIVGIGTLNGAEEAVVSVTISTTKIEVLSVSKVSVKVSPPSGVTEPSRMYLTPSKLR